MRKGLLNRQYTESATGGAAYLSLLRRLPVPQSHPVPSHPHPPIRPFIRLPAIPFTFFGLFCSSRLLSSCWLVRALPCTRRRPLPSPTSSLSLSLSLGILPIPSPSFFPSFLLLFPPVLSGCLSFAAAPHPPPPSGSACHLRPAHPDHNYRKKAKPASFSFSPPGATERSRTVQCSAAKRSEACLPQQTDRSSSVACKSYS